MPGGQLRSVIRYIRRIAGVPPAGEPTDGQLLERFALRHEEEAFEALLRRHGPMVLGVCQRVLNDPHDAEDAFQATFLVLVRKARAIAKRDSVGSWLYGVAYRTALKARAEAAKRRVRERQAERMVNADPLTDLAWRDLRPVLDEELNRLPQKYRAPLVLCYLEGKTNEEAAQQLGWTKGTVSGRLARARDLLRNRLTRRGLALSTGVLVTALSENAASAVMPAVLVDSTVKAAVLIAVGKSAAAGAVSAQVAVLTEGVMKTMFVTKLKILAAVVLAVSVAGTGAGLLRYHAQAGAQTEPKKEVKAKADRPSPKKAVAGDKEKIVGTWKVISGEQAGKPVEGQQAEFSKVARFVITADKITVKALGLEHEDQEVFEYKLDPDKDPKVIELTGTKPEGKHVKGIYALEGDKLKICMSDKEGEEPTEFKTAEGTGLILLELKRVQPNEKVSKADQDKATEAANRIKSSNNLKQLALAMCNYESAYGRYPPAAILSADSKPLLSWRVLILPYVEQDALYKEFHLDEPWDSEHNKKLLARMPKLYAPVGGVKTKEPQSTFYQVFTGKDTVFEDPKGNRIADITDGTSNTILIVEAGAAVPWTKPEDLAYDADKALPKLGGLLKDGFNVALCDGSVHFIKKKFDEHTMRLLITRNDGQPVRLKDLEK